jgi:hypothetical protein
VKLDRVRSRFLASGCSYVFVSGGRTAFGVLGVRDDDIRTWASFDVLLRDPRTGKISGVEVKSTLEEFNRFNAQQNAADRYINRFGARAVGAKAERLGITDLDSMTKILWEAPKP